VFVADLDHPALSDPDRHHLSRVLRLRPREVVTASDGAGGWRPCLFGTEGTLEPTGEAFHEAPPRPTVTVGFALTKGDRPEWTVQKLAEAGVDRIVPMVTARTVVRWDTDKAPRQVARLQAVAHAAAMQSRRVWLPEVAELASFEAVMSAAVASGGNGPLAMADPGGAPPSLEHPTLLVGPEGGWDDVELASGLARVTLGPTVLRAETAAMAAGLLLCGLRAGVIGPAAP
jgi:16S rRNA (uracil1498-N3)-methyltransferase